MNSNQSYWLLLEKSDETRVSKGIDGYEDKTGEEYNYNSLVPNHKNLKQGDFVLLRKENIVLGMGEIGEIRKKEGEQTHRRCPKCRSTDTRERSTKKIKWKCGKCCYEFEKPIETKTKVDEYSALIEGFAKLNPAPNFKDVKNCASEGSVSSQLSILQLDRKKVHTLVEGINISHSYRVQKTKSTGQGFGLSHDERKSVEARAMKLAREFYENKGWKVVDKSRTNPFDLLATKDQKKRFIEVKGTTGEGHSIILTHGEVEHVKRHKTESALVVVNGINIVNIENQTTATGGKISMQLDPWCITESNLKATQFRYKL